MADCYEIDFLDVEADKSGDAIAIRYALGDYFYVHVVDGGFQDVGAKLVHHLKTYYETQRANHVVVTHPDGDHAGGLRTVLEECTVDALWMLRPWLYADTLLPRFVRYTSADNLRKRLRELYPNLVALEEIALRRRIPISEPFAGAQIGAFRVLSPTREFYLDLIVDSERTPESVEAAQKTEFERLMEVIRTAAKAAAALVKAAWGAETFSPNETSAENEMSVVQYAELCGERILLTGDAGRRALTAAAGYAMALGVRLPGLHKVQVPHHGSRRNVSTEVLDCWLGPRLARRPSEGAESFTAVVSSAKKDEHHPRKSVVRAFIHRGGTVLSTEGTQIRVQRNAPTRQGWVAAVPIAYPDEQEA